jgi:hypothetical protein
MKGAGHEDAFASAVVGEDFLEGAALGRAVFGMGVIIVEARAIAENEVAFDFGETELALRVLGKVVCLVTVLAKFVHAKSAHVGVWIFAPVIPTHPDTRLGGAADQGNGFGHYIDFLVGITRDADFGFETELNDGRYEQILVRPD